MMKDMKKSYAIKLNRMPFDKNGVHATGRYVYDAKLDAFFTEYEDDIWEDVPTVGYEDEDGEIIEY